MYNVQVLLNLNKWKKKKQVQLVIKILALLMISGSTVCVIVNHLYYTGYVVPVLGVAIMYFLMTALQSIICIVFLSKPLNDNMLEKIYKNSTS